MSASTSSPQSRPGRHFRLRLLRDRLARRAVAAGGIGVIVAILLIFIYLLYVVLPLLETPEMAPVASYVLPGSAPVLHLAMDEQAEVGALFDADGQVRFLSTADGSLLSSAIGKDFTTGGNCQTCHTDTWLTTHNTSTPDHTSLVQVAATDCASCHGIHAIFPSTDERSTVAPANLQATCGECHPAAWAEWRQSGQARAFVEPLFVITMNMVAVRSMDSRSRTKETGSMFSEK